MIRLLEKKEKIGRIIKKSASKTSEKDFLKKYFSENYFDARTKFRLITSNENMASWSETVQEDLTMDFAFKDSGSDKLLIIVSGVHGVEGYAGSALQLLFMEKIYEKFNESFSLLVIHAYNPYGFCNNRRVNENNVDLNRNCLKDYNSINEGDEKFRALFLRHKKIFSPDSPRKNGLIEESKYSFALAKVLLKHGVEGAITAGSRGQNLYPKGVGFIGLQEEKSTRAFKDILVKFTPNFKKTILVDIHTGLGRRNSISAYAENPKSSAEFATIKKVMKGLKSRESSRISSLSHSGSITEYFYKNSKSKVNISLIIEIGTVSNLSSTLSLATLSRVNLEENQITHFGPRNKLEKARKNLRNAYFPNAKRHRRVILEKSGKLLEDLCCQIEIM